MSEPLAETNVPATMENTVNDAAEVKSQADKLVAEGKKAIALKDWEQGVEKYGEALALM